MRHTLDNLSLRGVLSRLVREPLFSLEPRIIFAAAYATVAAVMAMIATILLSRAWQVIGGLL